MRVLKAFYSGLIMPIIRTRFSNLARSNVFVNRSARLSKVSTLTTSINPFSAQSRIK
ncbi:hypothetical protein Hanom_Chr00s047963g01778211 [Helianthus anomalus]